ncbi:hypothetical protein [Saccharothrix sp. BKS2]|uniref:hypothetical protein n=1 Tax=Saccharothrix sp. BKS2 TaxID=3064400 RepID=UPI0039E809BE
MVGLAAVTGALVASAPTSGAAPADTGTADLFCLVQPGETTRCAPTQAEMLDMAPAASHVLNLWEHPNYEGFHLEVWNPNGDCTPESDFSPPDAAANIPLLNGQRWVSSVRKIDTGHCNWVLVGPQGNRSVEVENDWPRLGTLGDGWDNRAARVLVD